jgi:hypothetical protein
LETSPQRQKQLGADKLVAIQIWKFKNFMSLFLMSCPFLYIVNIMQYFNHESEINIFTWKGFEQCAREETANLATLKSKSIWVVSLLKETAEIEQEWQKSPAGTRQTDGKTWFDLEK